DYVNGIAARAATLPNVTMFGAATRDQIDELFARAACLCCTSDHEGFPNTFLEAWSHGCPVVTTWDPDDIIAKHGLGTVATDAAGLAVALREVCAPASRREEVSATARKYFRENHAIEEVMPRFENVFAAAASSRRGTPAGDKLAERVAG